MPSAARSARESLWFVCVLVPLRERCSQPLLEVPTVDRLQIVQDSPDSRWIVLSLGSHGTFCAKHIAESLNPQFDTHEGMHSGVWFGCANHRGATHALAIRHAHLWHACMCMRCGVRAYCIRGARSSPCQMCQMRAAECRVTEWQWVCSCLVDDDLFAQIVVTM